jgi:pimeloyl-ACP methyl ester carboxylesterase
MRLFETVRSKDGTSIAYERRGHGPPLVMVHGSAGDHTRWGGIVSALAERFTLYMMDRRGRGRSGDGAEYAIEREFEDVVALLHATDAPACLLGHSYGALCSLEAARLTTRIARMVLYEPPFPVPDHPLSFPVDLSQQLAGLLAAGDRAGVVETFLREVLHFGASEISRLRRLSSWPVRLEAAATLPREVGVATTYRFRPEAFAQVRTPALFLFGNRSPGHMQASTLTASAAVAGSRAEMLVGQGHAAMSTGPRALLEKALPFLTAQPG